MKVMQGWQEQNGQTSDAGWNIKVSSGSTRIESTEKESDTSSRTAQSPSQ